MTWILCHSDPPTIKPTSDHGKRRSVASTKVYALPIVIS